MRLIFSLFFLFPFFLSSYEVLTISDSIVDYILFVEEEYLEKVPGKKGGSMLVDNATFEKIIARSNQTPITRPGGSAVNMIKGLKELGHSTALITTIGEDEEGTYFLKSLEKKGISLFLSKSEVPTGKSTCLVTPNGERTMRTFLGASKANNTIDLHPEHFQDISHFHLEGYQLFHRDLVKNSMTLAKNRGATISLDLSSFEIVRANTAFLWDLLKEGLIDILFCNQEEARMLTSLDAKEASRLLGEYCRVAIVTMGEKGCHITCGEHHCECAAFSVPVVDTIGAGDLFISGFLHGYLTGQPLETCACWGTLLASHVVQEIGAEISEERWDRIRRAMGSSRSCQ